ncbi:hypothetical protein JVU11DRAFT_8086 [Chiua virens]|nr:hypothetical protein JVU11DRAFT_8086 [Chiua virens]
MFIPSIGYWPDHKTDMLLGDMSTWRSELKTTAYAIAPVTYKLIPPQDIAAQEKTQWVQNTASRLLTDSLFLRDGVDELGKTNNFAHPALKELVIKFFYMGSYQIADKCPNQFHKSVPLISVVLAGTALNCVLDGFTKNGASTLKMIPQFSGKEYQSTFQAMVKMLNEVLHYPYHGQKLCKQLNQWAQEGWLVCGNCCVIINYNMTIAANIETRAALHQVDTDVEQGSHLQVLLD